MMDMDQFDLDLVIQRMQNAVDIVLSSEHETSKVAACLFHPDGDPHKMIARTNHRPEAMRHHFEMTERIGKSSQFVHAETACVLEYEGSPLGHYLCVTDPFCPNCAKTIIESGVERVFIDHKGMDKDFVKRRAGAFNMMSLKMTEEAGIDVYILYRKERRFEPLALSRTPGQRAGIEGIKLSEVPADAALRFKQQGHIEALERYLLDCAVLEQVQQAETPTAMAVVEDAQQALKLLKVEETMTAGLLPQEAQNICPEDTDKYRFAVDPMNKLYFALKREGYNLLGGVVYCNRIPSSRAFVNAMLTDVRHLVVRGVFPAHDDFALDVAHMLHDKGLIHMDHMTA